MAHFTEFSDLLNQYLIQRDRSSSWLAHRLAIHRSTVNRWLNQATHPSTPEQVIRVADVLGVYAPAERQALLVAAGFAYVEDTTILAAAMTDDSADDSADEETIADAPPPQAGPTLIAQPRGNLPAASTPFVGRERDLDQITARLADPTVRLVTIVGLGGMGKSRLAVEAAARMAAQFEDGVWFLALASVTRVDLIPAAIATTLGPPLQGAEELEPYVLRYLRDKKLLLILDNLEHLLESISFIERMLAHAPGIKVLVTSRVRLKLDLEWILPLEGLTVPTSTELAGLPPAACRAVELFVQEARRVQPDFTLTGSTAADAIDICRLVDGMPLAIKLAAAWLRVVPLAEIAGEIQANLDFLATSMQNASERHHSMRAVFDHSWQLLTQRERHVLMSMSYFRGGFTREAAAKVAGADLNILLGLIDSSWLQLNSHNRYEIHELTRQYVEQKLDAEPATATAARAAHAAYYAALADRIGMEGAMSGSITQLDILLVELDNFWAGWHWVSAQRDFDELGKYVVTLEWLADSRGLYGEVIAESEKACTLAREMLAGMSLSTASANPIAITLARLLNMLCYLYGRTISVELGQTRGAESIELLRQLKLDGRNGELSPIYLGALTKMSLVTAKYADYPRARLCCEEVMHLTQGQSEFRKFYYRAVNALAQVAYLQGNFAEAEQLQLECLAHTTDNIVRTVSSMRLGQLYADMGDITRATRYATVAVTLAEKDGNRPSLAAAFLAQAKIAFIQRHLTEVAEYLDRVAVIAEETGNQYVWVRLLLYQARLARLLGRASRAQELYEQAYALADTIERKKETALAQVGLGFSYLDQEELEDAQSCFHAGLRAAWERRIMPEVLWALVGLAALQGNAGRPQVAERWLLIAEVHPACPEHVQQEIKDIRKRLAPSETSYARDEDVARDPDADLENAIRELQLELPTRKQGDKFSVRDSS